MMRWFWLVLALVVSTVGAGRLTTFTWDRMPDWPPDTTVELCGNGDVCLNGLTGTQATLDLPVSHGDVIQGRARAVAPLGYQCGTPPVPCPHSDWATVAQTWPLQGIGGWAQYERQEPSMAITAITGNVAISSSSGTTASGACTQSITIPTGARFALISFAGYVSASASVNYTSISLDGVSATLIANSNTTGTLGYDTALAWVALTAGNEGANKTLAWTNSTAILEGGNVLVRFYAGVDTSSPVRSSGVAEGESIVTISPGSLTAQSGDLAVAVAASYQPTLSVTWTNATKIFEVASGNSVNHTWAEASPTGNITISANGDYPGMVVAIIKPAADVSTSIPFKNHANSFAGILVR